MLLESPPAKTHAQLVKRERREMFYHENPDSNTKVPILISTASTWTSFQLLHGFGADLTTAQNCSQFGTEHMENGDAGLLINIS